MKVQELRPGGKGKVHVGRKSGRFGYVLECSGRTVTAFPVTEETPISCGHCVKKVC